MSDKGETGKACPICGKPSVQRRLPFCSKRCADIDLGRWLKGVYAIPVSEAEDTGDGDAADQSRHEKD